MTRGKILRVLVFTNLCIATPLIASVNVSGASRLWCTFAHLCEIDPQRGETFVDADLPIMQISKRPIFEVFLAGLRLQSDVFEFTGFAREGALSLSGGSQFPVQHMMLLNAQGLVVLTFQKASMHTITYLGRCD